MKINIYQGEDSQWYWRMKSGNNRIIATGGEGYVSKRNALRAIKKLINDIRKAGGSK